MASMRYVVVASTLLLMPAVAFAAPSTFKELVDRLVVLMDLLVPLLITVALVFYLFGISQNVLNFADQKGGNEKMKAYMLYGVLILFVMVSIWGILRLMSDTLFSTSGTADFLAEPSDSAFDIDCGLGEC
ncbi:MAG: hypothetical protein KBE09_01215 [Candidatus Pacebacteria bacterium]|nr:hypothetical protein [Candidatus Paceibacterota bacterium]